MTYQSSYHITSICISSEGRSRIIRDRRNNGSGESGERSRHLMKRKYTKFYKEGRSYIYEIISTINDQQII
jgi:hypothetical protein